MIVVPEPNHYLTDKQYFCMLNIMKEMLSIQNESDRVISKEYLSNESSIRFIKGIKDEEYFSEKQAVKMINALNNKHVVIHKNNDISVLKSVVCPAYFANTLEKVEKLELPK